MAIGTFEPDKLEGIDLKTAGLVAATANETEVYVGGGQFEAKANITAIEVATGDEQYICEIQANSLAATTTWKRIATLFALGADGATGRAADDVVEVNKVVVINPYDNEVRVTTNVAGTIATGINYTVKAYHNIE